MQKRTSDAPNHANLRAKLARNNCKIPEILARRAQRNCLNSASMRCVSRRTSLKLLTESDMCPNAKKVRVWRRCHANFAPNSREKIAKFLEIRRAARTKNCVHSVSNHCACCNTSLQILESKKRPISKRRAFGVEITQMLRQNRAEETQNF